MATIDNFAGQYNFLSNFYPNNITLVDCGVFPSVEHAYQAMKTNDPIEREQIRKAFTPARAKKLGREFKMRSDWEDIKDDVMLHCLRVKFNDLRLAQRLRDTGDAELIEGNTWGDVYWGVCRNIGQNKLGKLLMQVRSEIS